MNNRIVKTGMQKARLVGQEVEYQYDELPFVITGLGFSYKDFMIAVKRGARIGPHQGYQARAHVLFLGRLGPPKLSFS